MCPQIFWFKVSWLLVVCLDSLFYFMLCNLQVMPSDYVKVHNFFVSYWFIQVKCFVNWCLGFTIAL